MQGQENTTRLRKVSKYVISVLIALVVLGIGFIAGAMYGNTIFKHGKTAQYKEVCTASVVRQYNDIAGKVPTSADEQKNLSTQLSSKAQEIMALPDMDKDPTCLYIALNSEINGNKNKSKAEQYLARIEAFADEGAFVNTKLVNINSLSVLKNIVENLGNPATGSIDSTGKDD